MAQYFGCQDQTHEQYVDRSPRKLMVNVPYYSKLIFSRNTIINFKYGYNTNYPLKLTD